MISVIIPTFNAEKFIERLIVSLNSQTVYCEIIIVDSSSTDNTVDISKGLGAKVVIIKKEDFNHGRARNLGVSHGEGDIFVFMTQDAIPFDEHAIKKLIEPLKSNATEAQENNIAAAYGRQIPYENAKITEKFARYYNYPETPQIKTIDDVKSLGIKAYFFSNVFSSVRRDVLEAVGGFPEDLYMFEDMLFAAKIMQRGYKIAYAPDARVIHSHDLSLLEQFKRYFLAGISFSKNEWFLRSSKSENEGLRFLKKELKYLAKHNAYHWCIYAMVEALFKYSGYKLGTNYDKIPFLKRKFP